MRLITPGRYGSYQIMSYGVRASGLQFPHRGLCGALLQVPEQRMVISQ